MNFLTTLLPILAFMLVAAVVGYLMARHRGKKEQSLLHNKLKRQEKKQQTLQQEFQQLNDYTKSLQSDKVKLASMNDELHTLLSRLKMRFASSGDEVSEQKQVNLRLGQDIEELKTQNELLLKNIKSLQQEVAILDKQKQGLQQEATDSRQQLTGLQSFLETARKEQGQLSDELQSTREQHSSADEQLKATQQEKEALQKQCQQLEVRTQELQGQINLLRVELSQTDEQQVAALEAELNTIKKELREKDLTLNQYHELQQTNSKLEHELHILREKNKNRNTELAEVTDIIDSYKNKNQSLQQLVTELREELNILHLQVTADQEQDDSKAQQAQLELKKALGKRIKSAVAANRDDLKKIRGLNNFVEKKLNRLGIFTYEQISQLDEELINTVSDALQFLPDRIIEDDWVGQASDLMKIKLSDPSDFLHKKSKKKKDRDPDNLKIIEGIGPKIEQLLKAAGIESWAALAQTKAEVLRNILQDAGPRYKMHNPASWPEQARLAAKGKWEELMHLQDKLFGGRKQ